MRAGAENNDRLRLLAGSHGLRAHAMGACGVGLAGVIQLLQARGWSVSGCDVQVEGPVADELRRAGIAVATGHAPAHLDDPCDLVVRSAAVSDTHPELARARALGIPVVRRGELLAALVSGTTSVAVCGTHGKTTTSCFVQRLLRELGDDPRWCIGGRTASMGSVAGASGEGPLVVEGDESDGTLALYAASVLVITNVDADHLEHFGSLDALHACFTAALSQTRRAIVTCADDPVAARLCRDHPGAISFGCAPHARLRLTDLDLASDRMTLSASLDGRPLGSVTLGVTGRHNALNALAALGAVLALGHPPETAFAALGRLDELPGRRFERLLSQGGLSIISDYSHHPAEIRALIGLAKLQQPRRMVAVFQPHRYTRTLALGDDFAGAFAGVDELVLLPVYAASEEALAGGATHDLYARFRRLAPEGVPVPRLADSPGEVVGWLLQDLRPGDLLLVVGAGDVERIGHRVADARRKRRRPDRESGGRKPEFSPETLPEPRTLNPPLAQTGGFASASFDARLAVLPGVSVQRNVSLASLTTLGVGGAADRLIDVDSEEALGDVLRLCREMHVACRVLGGGSNLLVSDLGVRGAVIRLAGAAFSGIELSADGRVAIGCGVPGLRLLNAVTEAGLDGLSFMDGIPGRVGGWLAMNAGAHGESIGGRVRAIRGLKSDGSTVIVNGCDAGFGYRHCRALETMIATRVELALAPGVPAAIWRRRREYRAKRLDFEGRRSAGSVFRNPDPAPAGRLLDEAGCKGMRVGGAQVFARHANVIVTEPGATASDVMALMRLMHGAVLMKQGVDLVTEVRVWQDSVG